MFEWDPAKAMLNRVKHGVSFNEAASAFEDPNGLDRMDARHSVIEERRLRLATAGTERLIVIAYTVRKRGHEEITRIISARPANRRETQRYEAQEN